MCVSYFELFDQRFNSILNLVNSRMVNGTGNKKIVFNISKE